MKPTIGRVVTYKTTKEDKAAMANANSETQSCNIQEELPAIIVAVWSDELVNLKVICDGNLELWKTSIHKGDEQGNWEWPKKS